MSIDPFIPVADFFPGRSRRWVNDQCRAGRIPSATKIGGTWFLRASADPTKADPVKEFTEEDAYQDLKRRGIL